MWSVSWGAKYYRLTEFPCPSCKSTVAFEKESLVKRENQRSRNAHSSEDWTPYDVDIRFSCMLVCKNPMCGEIVAVSGYIDVQEELFYGEDETTMEFMEYFRPLSMYPAPPVIPVSPNLSSRCQEDLRTAFSLLWVDTAACANRQRVMVEHMLDQLQIPRRIAGKPPGLNSRIEKLSEEHPRYGGILDALKEVGNAGSHDGAVRFDDVVQCFKLIEHVVTALIDKPDEKVEQAALELKERYRRKRSSDKIKENQGGQNAPDTTANSPPSISSGGD